MDKEVVWEESAVIDLESIAEYISRDSLFYSAAFVQEIKDASRSLSQFSERGRIVPELNISFIRELLIREYRLIYKTEKEKVVILALIHGARNFKTYWEKQQN